MRSYIFLKYIISILIDKILNRGEVKDRTAVFKDSSLFFKKLNGISDIPQSSIQIEFVNKYGKTIYLSAYGVAIQPHAPEYMKKYKVVGILSYCFEINNKKICDYNSNILPTLTFEYCKKSILDILNSKEVGGEFTDMIVQE